MVGGGAVVAGGQVEEGRPVVVEGFKREATAARAAIGA